jgi:ketosteroid isomerase-like protein
MEASSDSAAFERVWELYAKGRGIEILDHLDPDVEWHPAVLEPDAYRGHAAVRRWASSMRRAWKSVTLVLDELRELEGCVLAAGRLAAYDHAGEQVIDTALACVAEFRRGLVVRARSFVSIDDALAWISARPALP